LGGTKVASTYNIIVVDLIEIARRLRLVAEFKDIPIILLALVVHISLKFTLDLGITSYITTPCLVINLGNSIIPASRTELHYL